MADRIFCVDDDESMCRMLEADLSRRGYEAKWFTTAADALAQLQHEAFDVLLTDYNMPGMNGIELCERSTMSRPDVPVIVMTAFGSLETAVDAIRAGAYDFVTKPVDMDLLAIALQRAVKHRSLQEQIKVLRKTVDRYQQFDEMIGDSRPMRHLFAQLRQIAPAETTVLITGESGTGKERLAHALHKQSPRSKGPFVAIDCAALPETLLENELFGHKSGAFTDAKGERKGLFVQADGGTLFLDEIGEIPISLQPKLLRALEERSVRPIGGNSEIGFDARLIAATNRDLETAVEEGRFREDLLYRLNVIQIEMPPLRARGTDILLFAQHFLNEFSERLNKPVKGFSEQAAGKLLDYAWPGNVRELRNVIERAVVLTTFDQVGVDDLPEKIRVYHRSHIVVGSDNPKELVSLDEVERRYILHVLETTGDNRSLAARILGLDRKTLYRKIKSYGVA